MFADKTVIVSGTGPGLGLTMAKMFAEEGANVVLASRNLDYIEEVAADINDSGGSAIAVQTDVTDQALCDSLADRAIAAFGSIDVLVNNAFNHGGFKALCDLDIDTEWQPTFDVNVTGTLRLVRSVAPALKLSAGAIVNINTFRIREPALGSGAYCSSKGALQNLSRTLALELGPENIRVNNVMPGYIDSDQLRAHFDRVAAEEGVSADVVVKRLISTQALGFIPSSREVAEAVLFLASTRASAITGASLDVNAGLIIP
ncbi:putative oxidoreductase [Halioglobus japonicus]|nr:putative oxidoreductase [Halioglobus japonicus]